MDLTYIIEPYSEKYQKQIRNVIGQTLADIYVIDPKTLPIDDKDLDKILQIYSGKGKFWIALADNKVIGTVAIKDIGENTAKLNRMFVLVTYHGSGIGQALLDCALQHAKQQGFIKIILNTHEHMNRAHAFYEKNDFVKTGKTDDKYNYEKEI